MVVGMRRTTRVFGVVKSGDGARILRSGRKLYSDPPSHVVGTHKKSNSGRGEWLRTLDDEDHKKVATGWCPGQLSVTKAEAQPDSRNDACYSVAGLKKASGMEIVKVYERKRKRSDWDAKLDVSACCRKDSVGGRMFGNHFVRRQQMRKSDDFDPVCQPDLVVMCTSPNCVRWLPRLLISILAYLMNHGKKLSKLHEFLCSNPIGGIFESRGIQFSQKCSSSGGFGYCKMYGVTQFTPSFSVNFSAIPVCFMYVHSSMLLQSEKLVFTYLVNVRSKTDDEAVDDSDEIIFCISSGDHISVNNGSSSAVNNFHNSKIVHCGIQGGRVGCHQMKLRSSFRSFNIRGNRSASRSKRGRSVSVGDGFQKSKNCVSVGDGLQKSKSCLSASGVLKANDLGTLFESPVAGLSCKALNEVHSIGLFEELKDSPLRRSKSGLLLSPFSNKRAWRADSNECVRNNEGAKVFSELTRQATDMTSCAANILVIDHDKCYRLEGTSVMLELSDLNRWSIVVKKDGFTKYSHMAEMVMKPCTFNRATHNIIWTVNNDWKLEFPTREDWSIFKELYKVCSSKNLETPNKIIPVPGVHIVTNYEDTSTAPYSRPDVYICLDGSEVSRVLAKTSASYDIDSEDEEWLANYNEEMRFQNESHKIISSDTLELVIDAIEKSLYFSSGDYLDEMSIADICPELDHEGFIEVVYTYWLRKRKQKCPTLVRVLQAYKPRKVLDIGGPVMRKKRSFKRHASQNGRGKPSFLLEGEQLALMEVEEAMVSATRYSEWAAYEHKRAQALMEFADLATYRAAIAVKIAQAAQDASAPSTAACMILM